MSHCPLIALISINLSIQSRSIVANGWNFIKLTCILNIYGPRSEKTCLQVFANNTGADQPGHLHSLISTFVIRFLESIVCTLATGEISIF